MCGWGLFVDSVPCDAHRVQVAGTSASATMSGYKRKKKHFQTPSGQLHVSGAGCRPHGDRANPCKVFVANISFKVSTTFIN